MPPQATPMGWLGWPPAAAHAPVLVDVDAHDLVLVHALEHDALAALQLLHYHAALAHVRELKLALVAVALRVGVRGTMEGISEG